MSQSALGSFDEDLARSISSALHEPPWLTAARLEALGKFASLPPETNPLYTKYARTFSLGLESFKLGGARPKVDLREFFAGYLTGKESNILLQGNDVPIHTDLDGDVASKGVKLKPLHEALAEDEKSVRPIVESGLARLAGDKYSAFVTAFFNSGTIVDIPRGVALDRPLRRMILMGAPSSNVVDLTFVRTAEESKLVFLEEIYSKEGTAPSLVASCLDIQASPGSKVDYSSIQLLNQMSTYSANKSVRVLADSTATFSSLSLGSASSRSRMNFYLDGRGSLAEGFEIFFTDGAQKYDFETNLVHNSPDSTGSTQARGVLKGSSQSIFKGMIKIVNAAKNSRSYLAHHAMLLERSAKSDAVPSLEIDNNEVKATHSASVAQVDEEQLFYLNARGLSTDEAKKMVVLGFFEPVLSRIPIEQTREGARFMIDGKWHGETRRLVDREALLAATGETTPEVKQTEDIFERHYKYR